MAHLLVMPRQGNSVESCILVGWKAKEGDTVAADQIVCEVETDKASFEVPAGAAGTVLKLIVKEGDDVPVMTGIAVIGQPGEDISALVGASPAAGGTPAASAATSAGGASVAPAAPPTTAPATAASISSPASAAAPVALATADPTSNGEAHGISPRARNLASAQAVDASTLAGTGPGGRVIERDVQAAIAGRPELTAAARAAVAAGASMPSVGSGLGGRAGIADIGAPPTRLASVGGAADDFPGAFTDTPVKGIRKVIAERMAHSLATTSQFTLNTSAKAAVIKSLRERFKATDAKLGLSAISVNDLVLFAVSRTLVRFPEMNAHKTNGVIRQFERVHLGMAVDTPRGLMVPVIRNADLLSLAQISAEAKRLSEACRASTISPDDLSGSTFSVTNVGALGIESFTPVLNAPEVAILGVCAFREEPVRTASGAIDFESRIGFSLTIDHQAVDGAPSARFLAAFCQTIAELDLFLAL